MAKKRDVVKTDAVAAVVKKPATVEAYLAGLEPERREALTAVRATILENLPEGYAEGIQYGMIGYFVPHSVYPKGYHCDAKQPLPFISLASQKAHMAAYLFCLYCVPEALEAFQAAWKADTGRLDMGKSCVRFRNLEQVSLRAIGEAVRGMPVERFVEAYEAAWVTPRAGRAAANAAAAKKASKKVTKKVAKKTTKKTGKTAKKAGAGGSDAVTKTAAKKVAKKKTGKKAGG